VHPSEQPAEANCNYGARVRLRLDGAAQPLLKRGCTVSGGAGRVGSVISGLPVQVLRGAGGLIHEPFGLHFSVARDATKTFLHFAAYISGGSRYAIFIHGLYSRLQNPMGPTPPNAPRFRLRLRRGRLTPAFVRGGFLHEINKRKMEDERWHAAEKEAAKRRATDRQILEDADQLVAVWNERQAKAAAAARAWASAAAARFGLVSRTVPPSASGGAR
jgi:hypothetical protein